MSKNYLYNCIVSLLPPKANIETNMIIEIQELIEKNKAGIRKLPGTTLKNKYCS